MPRLSAPEIAALCTKAARGAGYEWGVAQEAGRAAVKLEALGLPGPALLSKLLRRAAAVTGAPEKPDPRLSRYTTPDRPLCSLLTGCFVSDMGAELFAWREVAFGPVLVPAMLAAFVTAEDIAPDIGISLLWHDGEIWIGPDDAAAPGAPLAAGNLLCEEALEVSVCPAHRPAHLDPMPDIAGTADDVAFLAELANRTYVPESEASRARGAGESAG